MKKYIYILFCITLSIHPCFSAEKIPPIKTDYFSAGIASFNYSDKADKYIDKLNNIALDLQLQFKISYMMFKIKSLYTNSLSKYSGITSTSTNFNGEVKNKFLRVELNFGFSYAFSERIQLTMPYIGLGLQRWNRISELVSTNINEMNELFYIPIGANVVFQLAKGFLIGFNITFKPLLSAITTVNLKEIYLNAEDNAYVKLKRGLLFQAEIPFEFYFADFIGLTLNFWMDYSTFGNNEIQTVTGPPDYTVIISKRKITSLGVSLLVNFYF